MGFFMKPDCSDSLYFKENMCKMELPNVINEVRLHFSKGKLANFGFN